MKRAAKLILIVAILLFTLAVLWMRHSKIARTHDELISIVHEELELDDAVSVSYAGEFTIEFSDETDALLWFIIQGDSAGYRTDYRAVECKVLSNNAYFLKKIYKPSIYAKDIAYTVWNAEMLFLINNTDCKTIIMRRGTSTLPGDILSQINILPNDYPYLYRFVSPDVPGGTSLSFWDSQGNKVR